MKRRALLATIGATAVAGCLGNATGGGNTTQQTATQQTTTQQTTTRDGPGFDVTEITTDALPDDIDARVDVTMTGNVSESQPAVIELSVTNTAKAERTWQFGALVPWSSLAGEQTDGNGTVLLAPGGADHQVVPDAPQDDLCWRATSGIALVQVVKEVTFQPNETNSGEYAFLAGPERDCLAPGTYRFEDSNFLGETKWGFEVTLTDVED